MRFGGVMNFYIFMYNLIIYNESLFNKSCRIIRNS